ncbi:uncharacterized protein G2W53_008027 [Senna tora]|uniref:Uncharacterized protein n=1 Tax=Senna tora TaxID=362788 RepID=A0A834X7Q2_9FABA|nr:uncharacterized protein G2W53_008027 [Senna tora]
MGDCSIPGQFIKFHGRWRRCATKSKVKRDLSTQESMAEVKHVPSSSKNCQSEDGNEIMSTYTPLSETLSDTNGGARDGRDIEDLKLYTIESLVKNMMLRLMK